MRRRRSSGQQPSPEGRAPFLRRIATLDGPRDASRYPFSIPAFSQGIQLDLSSAVTFFVGENGSGKSTLLEAIADHCGFNAEGGNRNHRYATSQQADAAPLAAALRLSWLPKVTEGFFLRAESFFNFATYLDGMAAESPAAYDSYGGVSLHQRSHGEAFLALFAHRFRQGLFLLDEPEAALSPQRQLAFLHILHQLAASGRAQFLIATHSPILMAYPGARVLQFGGGTIQPVDYRDTEHFQLLRAFLASPEQFFRHLFGDVGQIEDASRTR